jgi:hypothetical protein
LVLCIGCGESGIGEEGELTTGGRGEIRSEIGKVTGMVADVPTRDSLGKSYGAFGGCWLATAKVEVLLVVSELNVVRIAEA